MIKVSFSYWRPVGYCAAIWALAAFCFGQTNNLSDTAKSFMGTPGVSALSYSQFSLELALRQDQNRFLDTYVDPVDYLVGSGDRFKIMFTAQNIPDINCEISADGNLFIKSVGTLGMGHMTLAQAVAKIREKVAALYPGGDFTVQQSGFRFSRFNIIGAVRHPGVYYVPAIWRVSEAIELAGGLTDDASQRHIRLQGFAGDENVDLIRFNKLGDLAANPLVCKGYTIIIPKRQAAEQTIGVAGMVATPGSFEYCDGDNVRDYIAFAGGLTGDSLSVKLLISSPVGQTQGHPDSNIEKTFDYQPQPGDNITLVHKEGGSFLGLVVVNGAVARPGKYQIAKQPYSLNNLLEQCGGIAPDGCREMIQVFRHTMESGSAKTALALSGLFPDGQKNISTKNDGYIQVSFDPRSQTTAILLNAGDSVVVPKQTGMVNVIGAVAAPGLVRFVKGNSVDYYIREAGGLGFDADQGRMMIVNPATGGKIAAAGIKELFDGEILYVPQKETKARP